MLQSKLNKSFKESLRKKKIEIAVSSEEFN